MEVRLELVHEYWWCRVCGYQSKERAIFCPICESEPGDMEELDEFDIG